MMPFDAMPADNRVLPSEVAEALRAVKAMIAEPDRWMQGSYGDGRRFCALGAIRHQQFSWDIRKEVEMALHAVAEKRGYMCVADMNDGSTHAEVLDALDEAIRRVE
jgi:hypothetical protein